MKKINSYSVLIFSILCIALSGCAVDISLTSILPVDVESPIVELNRREVDFVSGEIVTTGNGYQMQGSFGEISEKIDLSNGYHVEGVFYE